MSLASLVASWGGVADNCYVLHSDASSFIVSGVLDKAAWTDATTDIQATALQEATRDIDTRNWFGDRYYYNQALLFPRQMNVAFPWNRTWDGSTIFDVEQTRQRVDVQRATALQAIWLLQNSGKNIHAERMALGIRAISESVGPVKEWVQYAGAHGINRLCQQASGILQPYVVGRSIYRA